jgi:hypothetical protein
MSVELMGKLMDSGKTVKEYITSTIQSSHIPCTRIEFAIVIGECLVNVIGNYYWRPLFAHWVDGQRKSSAFGYAGKHRQQLGHH